MRMNYFKLKFLLLFFALAVAIPPAWAETVTDVITADDLPATGTTYTYFEESFNSDAVYSGATALVAINGDNFIQINNSSNSTVGYYGIITTTSGGKVKSITIELYANASSNLFVDVYGKNVAYEQVEDLYKSDAATQGTRLARISEIGNGEIITQTITPTEDYEYIGIRSSKNAKKIKSITVVWETESGSTTEKVATPTFSPAGGTYTEAQSVEISCATDGATIYYTIDGTDPDENSDVYSSAINVDKTMTIKAIAMNDGMDNSAIASATYTFPITNLADANELSPGTEFVYNGYAVVTHVVDNNQYQNADVWIRDNQGNAAYLFRAKPLGFKNGDVLQTGWTATKAVHNGLNEFTSVTMVKDGTAEAKPEIATEIKDTDVSKFVRLESISTIGNGVQWYDKFGTGETLDPNKTYNVEGIVGYNNGLQFYPITVEEIGSSQTELTITLNPAEETATVGETITVTVTTDSEAEFQATCDDANATVQQVNDGFTITSNTAGTYTVSVYATDGVLEKTVTGKYTFEAAPEPGEGRTYQKVTSTNDITDGKYLIVYEGSSVAFDGSLESFDVAKNNQTVSINDNKISTEENIYFTYDSNAKTLKSASGYYIGGKSKGINASKTEAYTYEITINTDGNASLKSNNYYLLFNNADDQQRFRFYASGQKPIQLYKEVTGDEPVVETVATPTFSVEEGTYTEVQNVEINCTTDGATIYYTIDGTDPTTSSTKYTSAIAISETTTLKAIAVKDGMNDSQVASATYTINVPAEERTYKKVTSTSQLIEGKKYIIVHEDVFDCDILGGISTTSTKYGLPITGPEIEDNSIDISNTEGVREFTLVGNNTGWSFQYENTYLTWTSGNSLNVATEISNNAKWTVDDNFSLLNVADNSRKLQFNSDRFACYTSVQQSAVLYVEDGVEPSVLPTVATPTFDPAPQEEAFTTVQNVTISCATEGATIHYTTDGSEPTAESAVYSEPIVVNDGTTTIKAIAIKEGMTNSEVASATYTVNLPTLDAPTFDHESKIYDDAFEVAITAAEDATIYYTTDGTDPTAESAVYKARIPVNKNMTIKAIAVKEGYKTSAVATAEYQIKVAKPTFSPLAGTYDAATQVSIVCSTEGATIHYTTDGTDPNAESPVYSQPIAVNSGTMTIKAIAIKKDMTNSDIAEGVYTIKQNAGLDFDTKQYNLYLGDKFNAPTLEAPEGLTVTYESNNTNVAEVNAETGAVTIKAAGEATITASWKATDTYTAGSASYTITVENKPVVETDLEGNNLDLVAVVGKSETGKIIVSGENLKGDITLTLNDTKGVFAIDVTSIAKEDAIGEVTVTYTPKAATSEDFDKATVTIKSTDAETVTVNLTGKATLPDPEIIADPESLTMAAKVGETATATFTVMASDLRGDITLTMSESDVFTIEPATILKADMTEDGVEVTVTYKPTQAGNDNATITIASEAAESITVTLAGTATVPEVVAMPTFSLVAGSYTGPQTVIIYCATEGATISYSTDGGSTWTVGNTVNVDKDMTIMAKAEMDGMTVSTTASATYVIITEETPETVNIETGYYQIKNLGNGLYANVAGRKTLNFTDAPADGRYRHLCGCRERWHR